MTNEEKLELYDRLEIARDILINIKDDMKLMASRVINGKEYSFIAMRAAEAALAANKLMSDILQVEMSLKDFLNKNGGK